MARAASPVWPLPDALHEARRLLQEAVAAHREPEDLGKLADEDGERDPVEVPVPDRFREEVGDEAEPGETAHHAQEARQDGEEPGQRDRPLRVPGGEGQDRRRDEGGQRRVGPEDEDAARPEDGVRDERDDGGVEPVDGGQARGLRVAHPDGNEDRREDEAGDEVAGEPRALVRAQHREEGDPAAQALRGGPPREGVAGGDRGTRGRSRVHPLASLGNHPDSTESTLSRPEAPLPSAWQGFPPGSTARSSSFRAIPPGGTTGAAR